MATAIRADMTRDESRIVFESKHFYAYQVAPTRIEIRLHSLSGVYSIKVGEVATAAAAHRFIERAERYPENIRKLYGNQ